MATQTTTATTSLDPNLAAFYQYLLREGTSIYQDPSQQYQAYPNARVAPLTSDQQAGMGLARSNVGNWQPYLGQAGQMAGGVGSMALGMAQNPSYQTVQAPMVGSQVVGAQQFQGAGDLAKFMNPYESIVTQQGIRALEDTAARQQAQANARYASAGAFGGSRQGLYDATLGSNTARAAGELANTSRAQNYNTALGAWQADANRMLQADGLTAQLAAQVGVANAQNIVKALMANQSADLQSQQLGLSALGTANNSAQLLAGLGNSVGTNGRADVASLLGIGDLQRGVDQQNLNTAYSDWQDQRNYPWTQLNKLSTLGNTGLTKDGTTTTTSPGPNTWAQLLGAGLGATGLLSQTGAFGSNGWLTGNSTTPGGSYGIVGDSGTDQFGGAGGFVDNIGDYGGNFDWGGYGIDELGGYM